ncbi:glycoside hydrolase family 104 protein [Methylibium sp.]|uniref:glycoside hydrolase family 24 protein n=1 Tax=Methylibium sp. TaxID=2067992 RepID=UPI001803B063|nr:glycoside hydrolase family 104 protein [Methylibium sp.]MBA3588316.1 glycoside hydrolase family 104 protein [Methylibium sp.]
MILANQRAFLALIGFAEGTDREADPYRVCYGYRHTVADLRDHPAITGEWRGEKLPDHLCRNVGLSHGCVSTAAGRYQMIRPTWAGIKKRLRLPDFEAASQDRAALYLIDNCGALEDVHAGRIETAIAKCSREWASLPGNKAGQPQRRRDDLARVFAAAGGADAGLMKS